jgi:hypothetical protein
MTSPTANGTALDVRTKDGVKFGKELVSVLSIIHRAELSSHGSSEVSTKQPPSSKNFLYSDLEEL